MRGLRVGWLAGVAGLLAVVSLRAPGAALAEELLVNGDFEAGIAGWFGAAGTATLEATSEMAVSGLAAKVSGDGSGDLVIRQRPGAAAGASYQASAWVAVEAEGSARLRLQFLDAQGAPITTVDDGSIVLAAGAFTKLTTAATSPPGTASAIFSVVVSGASVAFVDAASLDGPTPVPTPTPTPTALPTAAPTPSPTRTPTTTGAESPTVPAATSTATSAATAEPTATPTQRPAAFGGLLRNGNFEEVAGGNPVGWSKFGGVMELSGDAYREARAVTLASETSSTKWIQQLVGIESGSWYVANAMARIVSGSGEARIRISWYEDDAGGGTAIAHADSGPVGAAGWASVSTGPVRAPAEARSARVRLMLDPAGVVIAAFDDAMLVEVAAPVETATVTAGPAQTTALSPAAGASMAPTAGRPSTTAGDGSTPDVGFRVAPVAGPHSLRISEVMSDPAEPGSDGAFEWVELVNVGTEEVDLAGWKLGDGRESDTLPAERIAPGAFVIVAGKSATLAAGVGVVHVEDGEVGNGLNNRGDTLRLVAPDGEEVDSLSFGEDTSVFDPAPPAPKASETIGVRIAGADPDGGNWATTLRPTPGEPNVFPAAPRTPSRSPDAAASDPTNADGPAEDDGDSDSRVPWVILGGALAAGLTGSGIAAQRAWPKWRKRTKRDG